MGNLSSCLSSCCNPVCQLLRWLLSFRPGRRNDSAGRGGLQDDVEAAKPKRRALLVGICYEHSPCNETTGLWEILEGTHTDVDRFRELLIKTYEYSPEDIIVLKDDPNLPHLSQPTYDNMIRELTRLVAGAAPGDQFTFLYSGHSDQQEALNDPNEEDDQDEVIITHDLKRLIDDDLYAILVKGLPIGCFLTAILDTCHSGTLLDLPHHHCNDLYVPWLSKGQRRTKTYYNKNVRGNAFDASPSKARGNTLDLVGVRNSTFRRPTSFVSVMTSQWLSDAPSGAPLRIITEIDDISSTNQHQTSAETDQQEAQGPRCSSPTSFLPSPDRQCTSPEGVICNGWCGYDLDERATAVSISACADLQRAWEGPRGSLTAVLCRFLEKYPYPSYRTLMTHVNFQIYENCRELHKYTLAEKKKFEQGEGPGFEGEFNNFQSPQLSSLSKLKMSNIFRL